jgi:GTPase
MFVDEVKIEIRSGKGGDGVIAFRREKSVPMGGPAGGDGGKGGSIIFLADQGMSTLVDLRYTKHIFGINGDNGKHKNMFGADAEDTIVKVPTGSILYDDETNRLICDLTKHGETYVVAAGGRGGRGNSTFATSRNTAPRLQENGAPGKRIKLRIELKLLADVGLVGFPSVGKSTLITAVSQSRPRIADYPFTTIIPNLGVVDIEGVKSFVMADLPGIIEGAHQGVGLGLQFLRHIERTRVIIHVVDMSPTSERDPFRDYQIIRNELKEYKFQLGNRPEVICANKMDMPGAEERLEAFIAQLPEGTPVYPISAMNRTNIVPLLLKVSETVDKTPLFNIYDDAEDGMVEYTFNPDDLGFAIEHAATNRFVITGPKVERLMAMSNYTTDEAVTRFIRQMRRLGVDDELRKAGAKNGDLVQVAGFEFEFVE